MSRMNNKKYNRFKKKNHNKNKKHFQNKSSQRKVIFDCDVKKYVSYALPPDEQKEIMRLKKVFIDTNCTPIEPDESKREIKE